VDVYVVIEQTHLRYLCLNQKKLCADLYQGLQDVIVAGDNSIVAIKQKIILPSFTRGPRHMVQNYQDARVICRWACCPDVFLHSLAIPNGIKIKRALLPELQP
jgi:hypothetical protein